MYKENEKGCIEPVIKNSSLSELVMQKIQHSILHKEFQAGTLLPSEKDLSERYGVGKSSVREALKMLHALGVVNPVQGKGTYLRKTLQHQVLTPLLYELMLMESTAEDLYELRLMFDVAYMRIAAAKATEEDKALAKARFLEYKELYAANLPADIADKAYHKVMLDATRNQFIIKIGQLIMDLCSPYLEKSNDIRNKDALDSHEKLLEIFCSGDVSGLEETVAKSMLAFRDALNS